MELFHTAFRALGGPGEIHLAAPDEATAQRWLQAALDEIDRIELKYSRYRPDSLISRLNAAAGGNALHCDEETRGLLEFGSALHAQSGGRFDLSSGVWRRAWNFRDAGSQPPSKTQLRELAPLVGWQRVERTADTVRLPLPGMELDLGGIGKEYAVDRAAVVLQSAGARHALINLAGDLRALGGKPDGSPWQVGIRHPDDAGAVMAEIALREGALTTSGDYERRLIHEGRRYGHLLDARTGWPVSHWRSVSVRAPTALLAGGLSTMAMLMEVAGLALLRDSGLDYLAVDSSGGVHTRSGTGLAAATDTLPGPQSEG